jgi:RNA polymerase sigma-70 factor (ECF subfamily)
MTREDAFCTTRWTHICNARGDSPQAQAALADLCNIYYAPLHAYITHTARDLGDPRDLTQEFFSRLLAGSLIEGARRERGRFRAYLLGAVKHFLADVRDRQSAAKRGAAHEHTPLDSGTDTSLGIQVSAPEGMSSDAWFDRQWGLTVLDRGLTALEAEHEQQGKGAQFTLLKPWLTGELPAVSRIEVARQLGISEGAFKAAIHRLRQRFRAAVKAQIEQTVSSEEELRDELRYLIQVVS